MGDKLVIVEAGDTVSPTALLATPLTVTTTLPDVAPLGTGIRMLVGVQLVAVPATPLNVTVLLPWAEPKLVPVIVMDAPTVAEADERLAMPGTGSTVNETPALTPLDVSTTTLPDVAPLGTGTTMLVALQLVGVGVVLVPAKDTVLVPCVVPKFTPEIVTEVPTVPAVGDRLVMAGVCETVNGIALLVRPLTVTRTFPEVAVPGTGTIMLVGVQLVGVPAVPLNVTELLPWLEPKFAPVIVTAAPATAVFGDKPAIAGARMGGAKVVETLSKVAVASDEVSLLVTASPTYTSCVMLMVSLDPTCVQFTASGAM